MEKEKPTPNQEVPTKPLSDTTTILLEYLPPHTAQNLLARLHNSLPRDPTQIREHLNKVHQELDKESRAYVRRFR